MLGFHDKTSHAFPNSIELTVHTTFGACDGSKKFLLSFLSVSCEDFLCTDKIESILHHDSVPVIVSGFTSLIDDFVIHRYQDTKIFCTNWKNHTLFLTLSLGQSSALCSFSRCLDVFCIAWLAPKSFQFFFLHL